MPVAPFVPLIAAGVGAAGAVASANASNRGQQQTATATQNATDAAVAEQRRQYDLSRADNAPWLQTGQSALGTLASLYGLNRSAATQPATTNPTTTPHVGVLPANYPTGLPTGSYTGNRYVDGYVQQEASPAMDAMKTGNEGPQVNGGGGNGYGPGTQPYTIPGGAGSVTAAGGGSMSPFFESPDYQFRLNESMRALTARNAALGIQDSGAAQRSAVQYAGNLASGEFNNYANRLSALAGVGQTAASQNQALGQNYANAFGNLQQQNAQTLASSYQNRADTRANLYGGLAGSVSNGLLQYFGNR